MPRKRAERISWHPDAKVCAMQSELQEWMVTHELRGDTKWWLADDYYHGKQDGFDEPPVLVLTFEGELYNVFSYPSDHPDRKWYDSRREEFDAVVDGHGYWYEFEDNVTMCFMPK